ncbi:hypothetical protein ABG768_025346 [Culter alburnus]|uniref:DUF4371 domain-containing protein n=1 Tax=Culter alburnus TaxID=194366 RepID=A0AAW1ZCU4_CULAL
MKPSHLQRHLTTKHSSCVGKTAEFFHRKHSEFQKSQEKLKAATQMSSSSLLASYEVSLLVAKSKKPYSIAEELIVPAAAILAETMLDKKAAKAIKTVPLSNDTVCRRIDDMAEDIVAQVVEKLKQATSFALQLDESTDISGESQLVAFVRYKDKDEIDEHILFCKPMLGKTTGEDIFNAVDSFFTEHSLDWLCCSHICTDGAASMTGRIRGFVSRVKQVHPDIKTIHCVIHREALASKRMSPKLHEVLNDAVKIINFVKSRPLNARLFKKLCDGVGSEHQQLLLHTDVRWLSRGKTLQRLFELREQVCDFLSEHLHPSAALLKDYNWLAHLAYLADVFSRLNDLNLELQGKDTSVLHLYDRVSSFMKKIDLWDRKCQDGDVSSFPQLNMYILNGGADKVGILQTVQTHVNKLSSEFKSYFPDIEVQNSELDWIRNPFAPTSIQTAPASLQERLIDLSSDRGLRLMFSETSLTQFWCNAEKEYPDIGKCALYELLPFGSTYLCEVTFSAMTHIKTKQRNRLSLERSLIAAVATLHPRMQNLICDKQVQISH